MAVKNITAVNWTLVASWDGRKYFAYPDGDLPGGEVVEYDNRCCALGSDANGIPTLVKHASAQYIYWHPTHANASDANAGTNPVFPKATLASAWGALRSGYGDWLLMANNATNTTGFGGGLAQRSGLSPSYPIVVTTYDPADPTNVSKMRLGSVTIGTNMTSEGQGIMMGSGFNGQYIVFENAVVGGTLTPNFSGVQITRAESGGAHDYYVMFHNVRWHHTQCTLQIEDYAAPVAYNLRNIVFRHCAGSYSAGQGHYIWGTDGMTLEDSVLYHNGWQVTRDELGGANDRDHNAYYGESNINTIFRRNCSGHASSHGVQMRGGGICHDNLFGSNPCNMCIGDGDEYNVFRPGGVPYDVQRNTIQGSTNINSGSPLGWGMSICNTNSGGIVYRNLFCNIGSGSTTNRVAIKFKDSNDFNLPNYVNVDGNIWWNWNDTDTLAESMADMSFPSQLHLTFTNNIMPADNVYQPSGGNRTSPLVAFPDPSRTIASYATANGYANEAALWAAMVANPKTHWAAAISAYIRAGFGW